MCQRNWRKPLRSITIQIGYQTNVDGVQLTNAQPYNSGATGGRHVLVVLLLQFVVTCQTRQLPTPRADQPFGPNFPLNPPEPLHAWPAAARQTAQASRPSNSATRRAVATDSYQGWRSGRASRKRGTGLLGFGEAAVF